MNVFAPSNLGVIQKVVMLILTFEIIPQDIYPQYVWDWTEEEELEHKYAAVGMDSRIFMISVGMPLYIFAIGLVLMPIALIMACCATQQDDQAEGG
jgi:hypothetical protein